MFSPPRRLDGLLAVGPHGLDAQVRALTSYAARSGYAIDVFWAILPGEDPAIDAPDSAFPIVAFDDEIAGFTEDELESWDASAEPRETAATDWHVAHATPQPKTPTTHLPVYGCADERETAADALLCIGQLSLDRQIALIEAYAIRSAIRLRGIYIATDAGNVRLLLQDFSVSNRSLGTGPTLTVAPVGNVEVHY